MKIHEAAQGTQAWLEARAGIPTASEFDALITPLWKIKTGEGPALYLAKKLAENWGGPLPSFGGPQPWQMEQGRILEEEAIPWYEFEFGEPIQKVGLITTDDGSVGCSPDGLLGEDGGIEIKCPYSQTHIKYLLEGILPGDYAAQVHGSLYVTGRKWWKFVSYRRGFPAFVLKVNRDIEIITQIGIGLEVFRKKFNAARAKLIELNGGEEPPKRAPMIFAHEFSDDAH
jgi:hypothetical protein